ncbi:LAMI_0G02938g1_1 [Lachancea mirantina]|uniref:Proteasome assembly chaperone 2 n=1 Tax=Lachancea mirantina TaxID=1230905 RepID=A0A1G4K825_9SACH|nr:LAMI_0G02938g1_1 [Lachancea mirantina]
MTTLLLPLVSTGNVPQLSTDLLLHSLSPRFKFVQELTSLHLYPFVGPLDHVPGQKAALYDSVTDKRYTTALELFYDQQRDLYVVQQRSPVLQHYENNFCKEVVAPLVKQLRVQHVIVLDSTEGVEEALARRNLPDPTSYRYSVGTCDLSEFENVAQEFQDRLHIDEKSNTSLNTTLFRFSETSFQNGITTEQFVFKLCYHLTHAASLHAVLTKITYVNVLVQEGDNSEDAAAACQNLHRLAPEIPSVSELHAPASWSGVYGVRDAPTAFDEGLYI